MVWTGDYCSLVDIGFHHISRHILDSSSHAIWWVSHGYHQAQTIVGSILHGGHCMEAGAWMASWAFYQHHGGLHGGRSMDMVSLHHKSQLGFSFFLDIFSWYSKALFSPRFFLNREGNKSMMLGPESSDLGLAHLCGVATGGVLDLSPEVWESWENYLACWWVQESYLRAHDSVSQNVVNRRSGTVLFTDQFSWEDIM